jgi:hypothetical protein
LLRDFYLDFIPASSNIRRVSYAASFGAERLDYGDDLDSVIDLAKRFHALSVREDLAVKLCREEFGLDAKHVLDPTLLLDPKHYITLYHEKAIGYDGNRLLAYVLDSSPDKEKLISEIAGRTSPAAYGSNGLPYGSSSALMQVEGNRTVEGWLASFHSASFVITDSFHGTVFSILFNKPFIAFGNPTRGMSRFTSLLKLFGLEDRLVVNPDRSDLDLYLKPIDWNLVNARLSALRDSSFGFLNSALPDLDVRRTDSVIDSLLNSNGLRTPSGGSYLRDSPLVSSLIRREDPDRQAFDDSNSTINVPTIGACSNPLNTLCTGCGVCISESSGTLRMGWNDDGFLVPVAVAADVNVEAVRVCPFNVNPDYQVRDEDATSDLFFPFATKQHRSAGKYESTFIGYSRMYRRYFFRRLFNWG